MKKIPSLAIGLLLLCSQLLCNAQRSEYSYWETYGQYVPLFTAGFLGCTGLESHDEFGIRALNICGALVTEGVIVKSLKYFVDEERPDGRAHNSFPSGHTATVFNGAELVRYEYGTWWGVGAYTLATAVGLSRVYHKRHYIWDVGAGAAFGVLSARVGIQTVSKIQEKRGAKSESNMTFLPYFSPKEANVYFALNF
ncbi:MAG: phosphatase PAP2 family protein [Bacteroidales bacterium]|nr:phosphatase PAP2 family protein [Bacteroidales bacterium]